ncbi:hypothetical protein CRG98_043345 [Punica granatum]|uniref:Wall-associated receptor kinase galacturonan-binding domain-containing protein n=1 Tax=Punica granatum TaxID=22663 RepID=A0A2I0HX51_PUNGR|nr:hypothetical protein CRG98_043345 [Punica granatum]
MTKDLLLCFFLLCTFFLCFHGGQPSFSDYCSGRVCNGVAIGYPFWKINDGSDINGSTQNVYCGYPGVTLIDIDLVGKSCPRAQHNVTIDSLPLDYHQDDVNITFYFNCSIDGVYEPPVVSPIPCLGPYMGKLSYVFLEGEELEEFDCSFEACALCHGTSACVLFWFSQISRAALPSDSLLILDPRYCTGLGLVETPTSPTTPARLATVLPSTTLLEDRRRLHHTKRLLWLPGIWPQLPRLQQHLPCPRATTIVSSTSIMSPRASPSPDVNVAGKPCPRVQHNVTIDSLPLNYNWDDVNITFYFNCSIEGGKEEFDWAGKCEDIVVATIRETEVTESDLINQFARATNTRFVLD